MRCITAAMVAAVLLATVDASAQPYLRAQPSPPQATPNQIAAQSGADAAALLLLYMRQLANTGQPVSQSDIDEAARQYFTNGAAVSTVPTSGPGAAYFQSGAAAMSYGPSPAPTVAGQATATPTAPVPVAPAPYLPGAEVPEPVPQPVPASASAPEETTAPTSSNSGTSSAGNAEGVTEAQPSTPAAQAAAPQAPPVVNITTPAPAQPLVQTIVVPGAEPESQAAPRCPASPSLLARIAPAFGGLLFGGLAVALWLRPRMLPATRDPDSRPRT